MRQHGTYEVVTIWRSGQVTKRTYTAYEAARQAAGRVAYYNGVKDCFVKMATYREDLG